MLMTGISSEMSSLTAAMHGKLQKHWRALCSAVLVGGYRIVMNTLRVDRGSQFTARSFHEAARILNVRLEYAGIPCPEGKPYIKSFFGSYKTEEVYRNEYNSLVEAVTGWESYCDWYRNDRLHQALWYKSPRDYANIACKSKLSVA